MDRVFRTKSGVAKRSVVLAGHKTSVSIEEPIWTSFKEIAEERGLTLSQLASIVDADRRAPNLSSSIRLFVHAWQRQRILALEAKLSEQPAGAPRVVVEDWTGKTMQRIV